MTFIADLQIHSRYALACSKQTTIPLLEKWARVKGVDVLGTGDFIHPIWNKELKQHLTEDGSGVLQTKNGFKFVLQGEVSNIFHQDGKLRKIHSVILARDFDVVDQIREHLGKKGKIEADGRPIFGSYSCIELVEDLMNIDKDIEVVPAHVMTPWFGLFGSKSGFDSVEECFKDQSKHIHAIETGMSADPPMLWRVSKWNKYTLLSNSDAHSFWPWRIGREATLFDFKELTYSNIIKAIRTREGLEGTIEVYPSYGKYHWDGHRNCNVSMGPEDTTKNRGLCPACGRPMVIGVENRIEELADKPHGYTPEGSKPFKSLIPLSEIISKIKRVEQLYSKTVWTVHEKLMEAFGSEFNVLLNTSHADLAKVVDPKMAKAIIDLREGKVEINPGYDGVYGRLIFDEKDRPEEIITKQKDKQRILSEF
ncbi:MAG: endonuclease Q family protein [Candidatus Aenigmatarchaeota archaeon]